MTDERSESIAQLQHRFEVVVNAAPSLEAFYALEAAFEYSDCWHAIATALKPQLSEEWCVELRRLPPDLTMWLSFLYRKEATADAFQEASSSWGQQDPDRMFSPHHHVPSVLVGVAAVHLALLVSLDRVGAVEYVAAMPNEHVLWPAVHRLELHEHPELIDRVLTESKSRDAVLLCLSHVIDEQCSITSGLASNLQWNNHDEALVAEATATLDDAWKRAMPARHAELATMLLGRDDAGAVIGPWIRHLVRCSDLVGDLDRDNRSRVATLALEQVLAAIPETSALELVHSSQPNAACVLARIAVHTRTDRGHDDWREWETLLRVEHGSLQSCNSVAWALAAKALRRMNDPHKEWRDTAGRLEPVLRRRARIHSSEVDPTVHLVMPGMHAAVCMGVESRTMWLAIFERARRHFLVNRPAVDRGEFRLCSYVFAAFAHIFDVTELEPMLALLPTAEHIGWAREFVASNAPQTPAAESTRT